MATTETKLDRLLEDVHAMENFLYALLPTLDEWKLRQGDDVLPYAKKLKLKIPKSLSGLDVTWETDHSASPHRRGSESLALARPGQPDAVGLTVRCI